MSVDMLNVISVAVDYGREIPDCYNCKEWVGASLREIFVF
jgi:hypothetical protein